MTTLRQLPDAAALAQTGEVSLEHVKHLIDSVTHVGASRTGEVLPGAQTAWKAARSPSTPWADNSRSREPGIQSMRPLAGRNTPDRNGQATAVKTQKVSTEQHGAVLQVADESSLVLGTQASPEVLQHVDHQDERDSVWFSPRPNDQIWFPDLLQRRFPHADDLVGHSAFDENSRLSGISTLVIFVPVRAVVLQTKAEATDERES